MESAKQKTEPVKKTANMLAQKTLLGAALLVAHPLLSTQVSTVRLKKISEMINMADTLYCFPYLCL